MLLFFDTETTGKVDFRMPPDHPTQPHLVQLAAILADDDGSERATLSVIVEPDGYEIPAEAAAIHGIDTATAKRCGVPLTAAVWPFVCLRSQARRVVAHNIDFDAMVIEAALARMPKRNYHPGPRDAYCTMKAATEAVGILHQNPRNDRDFKWPKLEECIRHFYGEDFSTAHDALADVRACIRVYQALQARAA